MTRRTLTQCTEGLMAGMKGAVSCGVADRLLQPWLFPICRDRSGTLDGSSVTDPPLQTIRKVTLALARRGRTIEGEGAVGFAQPRRLHASHREPLTKKARCSGPDSTTRFFEASNFCGLFYTGVLGKWDNTLGRAAKRLCR